MAKKNLYFFHPNYPGQFGPITKFLLENYDVDLTFFSQFISKDVIEPTRLIQYEPDKTNEHQAPYFFSRYFEQEARHMWGIYQRLQGFKAQLPEPDVLVGHVGFGNLALLHAEYPDIPRIGYFELFYDPFKDTNPKGFEAPKPNRVRVPLRNATFLIELEYCTKGYSPTDYQRSTFPEAYQHKLSSIFDGVDTHFYTPGPVGEDSELKRTWPVDAPIITFVSRGLEAYRGFDVFMEAAHKLSQRRPDVHFVIAGRAKTHYGSEGIKLKEKSFKDHVLEKHPYDLNRFHFLDWISESALRDLFRLSACHFYWTVPFTLSWSCFQAMASGVLLLGSDSPPVRDAVKPEQTGVLMPSMYDTDAIADQMEELVYNQSKFASLREGARELVTSRYSFDVCLPQLADYYLS